MASREHSCTRRGLLAGAAAAAALPSPSRRLRRRVPPSPARGEGLEGEWSAALGALRRAEGEVAAFRRAEPEGASFAVQCRFDDAFSDLVCARNRAIERVLLAAAPDLAALAVKVGLAVDALAWELPQGEEAMAQLRKDAERLAQLEIRRQLRGDGAPDEED